MGGLVELMRGGLFASADPHGLIALQGGCAATCAGLLASAFRPNQQR